RLIRSPSGYPSTFATPALEVATAGNPACSTMRALATSHALGKRSTAGPAWSRRSVSAFSRDMAAGYQTSRFRSRRPERAQSRAAGLDLPLDLAEGRSASTERSEA